MTHYVAQVKNNKTSLWELWHGVVFYKCATEAQKQLDIFLSLMLEASTCGEAEISKDNYRIISTDELSYPHKFGETRAYPQR